MIGEALSALLWGYTQRTGRTQTRGSILYAYYFLGGKLLRGGGDSTTGARAAGQAGAAACGDAVDTHSDARGLPAPTHTAGLAQRGGPPACRAW